MLFALALMAANLTADPPKPYGPVPTKAQLAWHEKEYYGFLHFTVNTFTDKEWGQGDEPESVFAPTAFDADQIAGVAKKAGMKGLILTAKHHDGFCLWPTKTTNHNVVNSPFKKDVVKLVSEACHKRGLGFGVYLSPWDRNNAFYGKPEYIDIYRAQLRELLTNYGPVFEVWHDGANGGDGYYGGAKETRKIDPTTYYDWPNTWKLVRQLQPMAVIFSDVGPDLRWVGNESGYAADPSWATFTPTAPDPGRQAAPGYSDAKSAEGGTRNGKFWLPAECDVSIRPGWFWHAAENDKVKTPEQLRELYFKNVGRGGSFLLNVPPDRRGQIHPNDEKTLLDFKKMLNEAFAKDLAKNASVSATNVRGGDPLYAAAKLTDGDRHSFWSSDDNVKTPFVTLSFRNPVEFNLIRLREAIAFGQRIDSVAVDIWADSKWQEVATATSIGNCRLIQLEPVRTTRVRLRVTKAAACPCLSEIGLFLDPNEAP